MSDETATEQPQQGMRFNIQRIYIKDSSFEAPRAPQVFQETWEPKMHLDMNTRAERVQDNVYEVTLGLTLRVTDKEERTAYIAEVQQAGVFTQGRSVQNFNQIERFLKSPARPKVFSLVLVLKVVTTPLKIKILKK